MTPEDRALIVRALRAEADRIEAGGKPAAYSVDEYEWAPAGRCIATARLVARQGLDDAAAVADDGWPEGIEEFGWGVCVPVEAARVVRRTCPRGRPVDYLADYAMVDPLTHVEPDEEPCDDEECERCSVSPHPPG